MSGTYFIMDEEGVKQGGEYSTYNEALEDAKDQSEEEYIPLFVCQELTVVSVIPQVTVEDAVKYKNDGSEEGSEE